MWQWWGGLRKNVYLGRGGEGFGEISSYYRLFVDLGRWWSNWFRWSRWSRVVQVFQTAELVLQKLELVGVVVKWVKV